MTRATRAASALAVAAAALACAAPVAAGAGTERVLVNANADGDTPVAGGTVRAYRCDRDPRMLPTGRPLRQRNGARAERTPATGVTLLAFARLPRCFVVSVSGGRAGGGALDGTFVGEGRNGPGTIENVPVTPVSTLVQAEPPRLSERRAYRRVQRHLDIPHPFDEFDLQYDDRAFDGDRFLAAARRAGGAGDLLRALAADADPPSFPARGHSATQSAGIAEWWKELDITKAALGGLTDFGASFAVSAVGAGAKWAFGRFLDFYGLNEIKDFILPKSDTERLLEMVQQINIRLNNLEASSDRLLKAIAELSTSVLAGRATELLTHINTNHNTLVSLTKLDPSKPGLMGGTRGLLDRIALDEPNRNLLHDVLAGSGGERGLLVADSRRAAAGRFFTTADSKSTRQLYEYYVLQQLRFANLLTELWNTQSCVQPAGRKVDLTTCIAPEQIKGQLDEFRTNILAQQALLKPALPDNRFVDVKKNLVWVSNPPWVTGAAYKPSETFCAVSIRLSVACVSKDWRNPAIGLAGEDEFRGLIESIPGGDNPFDYLKANAGLVSSAKPGVERDHVGDMWLGLGGKDPGQYGAIDAYKPVNRLWCFGGCHQRIERVQLQSDTRPGPYVFYHRLTHKDPENHWAHAMPRPQPVAPFTYWYP